MVSAWGRLTPGRLKVSACMLPKRAMLMLVCCPVLATVTVYQPLPPSAEWDASRVHTPSLS